MVQRLLKSCALATAFTTAVVILAANAVAHASCPQVGFAVVEAHASLKTRAIKVGRNQTIFVRREPITTTGDIVDIKFVRELAGDNSDDAGFLLKFTPAAAQRLHEATTNHSGRRIAFMFNDEVLLNVVWEGPYGMETGGTRVSMHHGLKPLGRVMRAIRGCTSAPASDWAP